MTNFKIKDDKFFTIEKSEGNKDYPRIFIADISTGETITIKGETRFSFLIDNWNIKDFSVDGVVYTDVYECLNALQVIVNNEITASSTPIDYTALLTSIDTKLGNIDIDTDGIAEIKTAVEEIKPTIIEQSNEVEALLGTLNASELADDTILQGIKTDIETQTAQDLAESNETQDTINSLANTVTNESNEVEVLLQNTNTNIDELDANNTAKLEEVKQAIIQEGGETQAWLETQNAQNQLESDETQTKIDELKASNIFESNETQTKLDTLQATTQAENDETQTALGLVKDEVTKLIEKPLFPFDFTLTGATTEDKSTIATITGFTGDVSLMHSIEILADESGAFSLDFQDTQNDVIVISTEVTQRVEASLNNNLPKFQLVVNAGYTVTVNVQYYEY